MQTFIEKFLAYPRPPRTEEDDWVGSTIYVDLDSKHKQLPVLVIEPSRFVRKLPYTILYSHSNGETVSIM